MADIKIVNRMDIDFPIDIGGDLAIQARPTNISGDLFAELDAAIKANTGPVTVSGPGADTVSVDSSTR